MNRKIKTKIISLTTALLTAAIFTGCKASISITAKADKSADLNFAMSLGKNITETIENISSATGQSSELFDSAQIKNAFNNTDFQNISVSVPAKTELAINGSVPAPENQKKMSENGNLKIANFVTCTADSLTLIISQETIQNVVSSLPLETQAYLELLMAPVISGEEMSAQDYIDLIAVIYGEPMAAELMSASIKVTLIPPAGKTIKKASLSETIQSKTLQNKAVFEVPVAEFLTLSSARTFSITW